MAGAGRGKRRDRAGIAHHRYGLRAVAGSRRYCSNAQVPPALDPFATLNPAQRAAVTAGSDAPLLIIAGAGTGKTTTLAHRIARLVLDGADPRRILLLTFSRRAAHEMIRRAQRVAGAVPQPGLELPQPLRMYVEKQHRHGDRHVFAPRSRFLPDAILDRFERVVRGRPASGLGAATPTGVVDVAARLRAMW